MFQAEGTVWGRAWRRTGVPRTEMWRRAVTLTEGPPPGSRWVPESARWLLTQGRVEEAHRYLLRCARLNGPPVGEDSLSREVRVNA